MCALRRCRTRLGRVGLVLCLSFFVCTTEDRTRGLVRAGGQTGALPLGGATPPTPPPGGCLKTKKGGGGKKKKE